MKLDFYFIFYFNFCFSFDCTRKKQYGELFELEA